MTCLTNSSQEFVSLLDDTIIYLTVQSDADADQLPQDLNKLNDWTNKWMMELNTKKCEVISVTRKRNRIVHQYKLYNSILTPVKATKYLGVPITSDLSRARLYREPGGHWLPETPAGSLKKCLRSPAGSLSFSSISHEKCCFLPAL